MATYIDWIVLGRRPPALLFKNFQPVVDIINYKIKLFNDELGALYAPKYVSVGYHLCLIFSFLGSQDSGSAALFWGNNFAGHISEKHQRRKCFISRIFAWLNLLNGTFDILITIRTWHVYFFMFFLFQMIVTMWSDSACEI